ncbi:MAG: trimeric intracellular cation channel family protein [Planctomycetaceae bacterium]|nr:trimeric intracellular cation channel family protein [Planctomycetaceae bacterium]
MYTLIEFAAVISGALYGVLLARRHEMDFVGVFSLAFLVAFGGGTLRDLFLDRHPLFWIENSHYAVIVFVLALITSILPQLPDRVEHLLSIPDALGLGLFSLAGALAALDFGTTLFIAAILGVVTGTFGGVMADIVCNRVPSLFRNAPLYATCSFTGCWLLFLLRALNVELVYALPSALVFIVGFRMLALKYNWRLPAAKPHQSCRDSQGPGTGRAEP